MCFVLALFKASCRALLWSRRAEISDCGAASSDFLSEDTSDESAVSRTLESES